MCGRASLLALLMVAGVNGFAVAPIARPQPSVTRCQRLAQPIEHGTRFANLRMMAPQKPAQKQAQKQAAGEQSTGMAEPWASLTKLLYYGAYVSVFGKMVFVIAERALGGGS